MDVRTGEILTPAVVEEYKRLGLAEFLKEMEVPPTPKQLARKPPKVGRNERCPCGSGKKFKRCCLVVQQEEKP